ARFRANLWAEGTAPWEEFSWIGKTLTIGDAELRITERIDRCAATMANPETGAPDTDTLKLLSDHWGHQDFGVFAEVTKPGKIKPGDLITVTP
ncbi:MAG: MOSC domain-containing protein, partial [Pseudomonadota bacterium]